MEATIQLGYALDTFYLLVSGALVMWMAAGFAMLEAGLVRAKNTAEILTKNIVLYSIACVMFMVMGYGIMYPAGGNGLIPRIDWGFMFGGDHSLDDVMKGGEGAPHYAKMSDFFFQVVFVATAMSIVSGAVAERMKLWSFLVFAVVMTSFIYPVQGYWKWGGGWLDEIGFNDFAGSGVVHLCGASAALAGVLLLGARKGKYGKDGSINAIPGANLPLATLGTFILWFGWFGFNGGSELRISDVGEANSVAAVFVNTNMAAAGGTVLGLITARLLFGKADLTMALNGALAAGGHYRRAAHALAPGGDAHWGLRRHPGGVRHRHPGQAAHRRPGGSHLGPWRGGDLGPARGAAHQRRGDAGGSGHRAWKHPGLGLRHLLHRLADHQAHHGNPGRRGRGIRGRGHR